MRRGGRLCPPRGSIVFADGFRVSEVHFAGRTESSAPTKKGKSKTQKASAYQFGTQRLLIYAGIRLLEASLLEKRGDLGFPAEGHDVNALAVGLALADDARGNFHTRDTGLGLFLVGLKLGE